jgi:hypothetical protein
MSRFLSTRASLRDGFDTTQIENTFVLIEAEDWDEAVELAKSYFGSDDTWTFDIGENGIPQIRAARALWEKF